MHSDVATLRKASMWHEASRIVREEGFRAFWKGNLVTIAHRLPYSSISFYTYERYKHVSLKLHLKRIVSISFHGSYLVYCMYILIWVWLLYFCCSYYNWFLV